MIESIDIPYIRPSEYKLCIILWENEPIKSTELIKLCYEHLHWNKSTTYTVIHNLSSRGVIENHNGVVISLYSKQQIQTDRVYRLIDHCFSGSIPDFLDFLQRWLNSK